MDSKFSKFIGRKVKVAETIHIYRRKDKEIEYVECELDPSETIVSEVVAETNNSHIRVWLPGVLGTADYKGNRINIYIKKQPDGSYQVERISYG